MTILGLVEWLGTGLAAGAWIGAACLAIRAGGRTTPALRPVRIRARR